MKRLFSGKFAVCVLLLAGCSSEEVAIKELPAPGQTLAAPVVEKPPVLIADTSASTVVTPEHESVFSDSMIAVSLEEARQHYISALAAQDAGDSARSSSQFENAIAILNELSYLPSIELNKDFNDLSKAVIEDYEQYISHIDILSPQTSIFALREKLNQITEIADSGNAGPTTKVVTGTIIPLEINKLVEQNIAFFVGRGREHIERWLKLSGRYFPLMKRIMREEGLPEEMTYLAMVESGLNPTARSWAKAVGMWQFVKGTGRLYGLTGNFWYDERRDFEKATRAAARHLRELHEEFGDWYLTLAAYNAGAGHVYRGIRRSGSKDFWEMRRRLPRETRNYIPTYIAITVIAMKPKEYGLSDIVPEPPLSFERVTLNDCVSLEVLAKCAGTETETMEMLNPELVQWCTPPGMKGYSLRVPKGSAARFKREYVKLSDDEKRDMIVHKIKKGETLASIAAKYDIPVAAIRESNRVASAKKLGLGRTLIIPVPRGTERLASLVASSAKTEPALRYSSRGRMSRVNGSARIAKALAARGARSNPEDTDNKERLIYIVRKGDTIGHIAEWYGVRAAYIRNWNDLPYSRPIRIGAALSVWVDAKEADHYRKVNDLSFEEKQTYATKTPAKKKAAGKPENVVVYKVKRGDTLWDIARTHKVEPRDLKSWNDIARNKIYAGQELIIRVNGFNSRP